MQHAEGRGARYAYGPGRRLAAAAHFVGGLIHQPQDLDTARIIAAPLLGQRHAAGGPAQEPYAERVFELADMPSDGRLADAELTSDGGEAAALCDPDQRAHPLEADRRLIQETA